MCCTMIAQRPAVVLLGLVALIAPHATDALAHMNSPLRTFSSGSQAALTEDGYQLVAELKSDREMKNFVKRVLAAEGLGVHGEMEDQFEGFIPFYSGTNATQSLRQMREELAQAQWV